MGGTCGQMGLGGIECKRELEKDTVEERRYGRQLGWSGEERKTGRGSEKMSNKHFL